MATYFITQATGQQSQGVIKHLLATGDVKIHALVRDVHKVPQTLHHPSITLFQGESKNFDDVYQAAQGCKGAFLNTVPFPGLEALQAKTIVEACEKANVESLVANTTMCTDYRSLWDDEDTKATKLHGYWSSKAEVEDIVRRGNFKAYTILRPGVIHFDFFLPGSAQNFPRLATHGVVDQLMDENAKLGFTDNDDISKYVTAALLHPDKFSSQEICLSNEVLTMGEVIAILSKVSGIEVQAVKKTREELEEQGLWVFGQNFQLWANHKDLSPLAELANKVQSKFEIPFTPLEVALKRDIDRLLAGLPPQ